MSEQVKANKSLTPFLIFLGIVTSFKDSSARECNNAIIKQATANCFFRLKNEYFGLAARPVEVGDQIALLQGFGSLSW